MKFLAIFALLPLVLAAPASTEEQAQGHALEKRLDTASHCGLWDAVVAGQYTLYLDQWGASGGSGSDCAQWTSQSGTTVAWKNTWTWSAGTNGIKSYTNANLNTGINKKLSAISSIASSAQWSYSSSNIVANVAYDLFTSTTSGGSSQGAYEIMIWLANYNAGPISYNYGSDGKPVAIASNVSLAGKSWNVYYGSNGSNYVYSFLPTSGTYTSFSGDVNAFLKYLTSGGKIPSSQYLTTLQFGTEATSGSATLTVSSYSAVIA